MSGIIGVIGTIITLCAFGAGGAGDCEGTLVRVGPLKVPWSVDQYEAGLGAFFVYREREPLGFKIPATLRDGE